MRQIVHVEIDWAWRGPIECPIGAPAAVRCSARRASRSIGDHCHGVLLRTFARPLSCTWTWRSGARTVELDEEETLPGTELQDTLDNRNAGAGAEQEVQTVRVPVGSLVRMHVLGSHVEIVVAVYGASGGASRSRNACRSASSSGSSSWMRTAAVVCREKIVAAPCHGPSVRRMPRHAP